MTEEKFISKKGLEEVVNIGDGIVKGMNGDFNNKKPSKPVKHF